MLNKLKKTDNKGFTIIEVMIVLAIAGLILLIVFLAVPALQRSQRNTSRKSDAGHISSAVNDFLSNSQGVQPGGVAGATWNAGVKDCNTIITDAGSLNEYTAANNFACGGYIAVGNAAGAVNKFQETSGGGVATNALTGQAMVLNLATTCPATGFSTTITPVAGNPNQDTLLYTTETSTGNWDWTCVTIE